MFFSKYKKVDLRTDFNTILSFFNGVKYCHLYSAFEAPWSKKDLDEKCIGENLPISFLHQRLFVGDRSFDLDILSNKDISVYTHKESEIIIRIKRGYNYGSYTYYRIVKSTASK